MRNITRSVILAGIVCISITGIIGQEYRATLLGNVLDPSGSAVPAARVSVKNIATGVPVATTTNTEGNYTIPLLQPGQYKLRVEANGFKAFERGPLELRISDSMRIDLKLEVGAQTETVTVTAESPLLNVTNASPGQVVDKQRIEELPFAKGVPYHLIALSPGLTRRGGAIEENPYDFSIANYAVAGSAGGSAIALDGVITGGLIGGSAAPSFSPPQESVEEFRVQTTSFDATQGFTQAANLNVSFKSGTNAPHGAFYYADSRPEFSANSFFNTVHGVPKPDANYRRIGGSFGGPVILPKIYNGKNRTFFFVSPERIHLHQIYGRTYTVPTAAERTGDFSELLKVGSQYQIYDPKTRTPAPGGRFVSNPFPGNIIPQDRISPIATSLLKNYPLPNQNTVAGVNNYASPTDGKLEWYWAGLVRLDHNISDRQRAFFSAHHFHRNNEDAPCFQETQNSAGCGLSWNVNPSGAAFDDVYTFSPSFIMDVRAGYERYTRIVDYLPGNQTWSYAQNGFPQYLDDLTPANLRRMPGFNPSGYSGLPTYSDLRWDESDVRSLSLNFTKTLGARSIRFGWEGRSYLKNSNAPGKATTGNFTFGTTWTQGPNDNSPASPIGQGLASMLLGLPTAGNIDRNPTAADSSWASAFFVQTDWRVTRRLTLNFGLRYEYESPTMERYNRSVRGFDPTAALPIAAQIIANYAKNPTPEIAPAHFHVQGGLLFAGVEGQPRQLWNGDVNNFLPRFGFAYNAGQNTVIRGGYGIYFGDNGVRYASSNQTGFSLSNTLTPSLDGGLTFISTLQNPFPNGIVQTPLGSQLGPMTFVGKSISFFNPNRVTPYVQRWQLGFQHQLPSRTLLDVSYAGNRSTKLDTTRNLDALPLQYLSTSPVRDNTTINYLSTNLPNPFYPLLPDGNLSSTLVARSQLLVAYPQFTGVSTSTNEGYSWYHSLQVSVERRMANGFTGQLAYTRSKWMQATSFLNASDPRPERVISNLDFPNTLTFSSIYELPLGHGRKYFSSGSKLVDAVIGRWQLEGVYRYQSGTALGFGNAIILDGDHITLPGDQRSINRWFNVDAFNRVTSAQLSQNVVTLSSRFSGIRSGTLHQVDLSALKKFTLHERLDFELRAEFLNASNAVYLSTPNTTPTSSAFGTVTGENGAPRNVILSLRARF